MAGGRKRVCDPMAVRRIRRVLPLTVVNLMLITVLYLSVGCKSSSSWCLGVTSPESQLPHPPAPPKWIHYPTVSNETRQLLSQFRNHAAAIEECASKNTQSARLKVVGAPSVELGNGRVRLSTGNTHRILITSLDAEGAARCDGGDYYETDLSGEYWKSRPPVTDLRNGTYELQLQVHTRFAGVYSFRVILLYANFEGLKLIRGRNPLFRGQQITSFEIEFAEPEIRALSTSGRLPDPIRCRAADFKVPRWSGRWTRGDYNHSCGIEPSGKFQCLDPDTQCEAPWCEGPLGRLDSNGWVYSAHCRFKLFSADEAWQCLDRKWLFSWGDSTAQHNLQNLLAFVMEVDDIAAVEVPRRMDKAFTRPSNGSQSLRVTMVYNGHADEEGEFQGLSSLNVAWFREFLASYFINPDDTRADHPHPDVMIMNSGLHDAFIWPGPEEFVEQGLSVAMEFWTRILEDIRPDVPRFVYKSSVAVAGDARSREYNPQKIETYNRLFVDSVANWNISDLRIVDGFDLTFPWHFDHDCSDGTHYGLKPSTTSWLKKFGRVGHQYFVDLMMANILLNAICLE